MLSFFDWFRRSADPARPWLVMGQGPSFSRHREFPDLDRQYEILGLNRTCRERRVRVMHAIDLHVLYDVPNAESQTDVVAMPWHPHVRYCPSPETLEEIARRIPILSRLASAGRLLWYNLSTGGPHRECSATGGLSVVGVKYFSSEAAIRLLAIAGVRRIRTLGMDGGREYAREFRDLQPLRAGHKTYSLQEPEIGKIVRAYKIDYQPLLEQA